MSVSTDGITMKSNEYTPGAAGFLACPACRADMRTTSPSTGSAQGLRCQGESAHEFPLVQGTPILIDDSASVFRIADFTARAQINPDEDDDAQIAGGMYNTNKKRDAMTGLKALYRRMVVPVMNFHVMGDRMTMNDAIQHVQADKPEPKILVIGCGDVRLRLDKGNVTYTDVSVSQGVDFVCDAMALPFGDESFDMVIAQAVLEHVADPVLATSEIHRVLKPQGHIFATTPFMQPIHLGAYDFTRFTLTGYRRLFKAFGEIELSATWGPGSSMAYGVQYFIASFASTKPFFPALNFVGLLISRPFKLFDKVLLNQKSAIKYAAGYLFFGRKSDTVLSDREIVEEMGKRLI